MTGIVGFVTRAVNVWLLARRNIRNWPIGIANSPAYLLLFAKSGLYGDAGLQIAYITLGIYGWQVWLPRGTEPQLPVTRTPARVWNYPFTGRAASFWNRGGSGYWLADLVYIPRYIYKACRSPPASTLCSCCCASSGFANGGAS